MPISGNNPHRRNRRRLGRGQVTNQLVPTVTVTSTGTTNATLTYSVPVVKRGVPAFSVATLAMVSATLSAPNVITCVMSGNVATKVWTYAANDPNVASMTGGAPAAAGGTFP